MVVAAADLFAAQGYRATTYRQIADRAGVSVETVQKHGPKAALLRAGVELASFGVEAEGDFFATELGKALLQIDDPDTMATFLGSAMLTINAPSARLWVSAVGAALGDAELTAFHTEMLASIRDQVEAALHYFAERGWLRTDVPFDDLVEAFCVVTSPETYVRFVLHDGKASDAYQAFVARTLRSTVLTSGGEEQGAS